MHQSLEEDYITPLLILAKSLKNALEGGPVDMRPIVLQAHRLMLSVLDGPDAVARRAAEYLHLAAVDLYGAYQKPDRGWLHREAYNNIQLAMSEIEKRLCHQSSSR